MYSIAVGPGTGVQTKFDVEGRVLIPEFLLDELKLYASSMERMRRQSKAKPQNRRLLFLTSRGNAYEAPSFNRLMTDLRRATAAEMKFMRNFRFHQCRATYGTWLLELALEVTNEAAAVAFLRDAMLHKDEATSLRYVRFREQGVIKAEVSNAFSTAFAGLVKRDWDDYDA